MKVRPLIGATLLAAAAAAGGHMATPNSTTLQDQVDVQVIRAAPTVVATPTALAQAMERARINAMTARAVDDCVVDDTAATNYEAWQACLERSLRRQVIHGELDTVANVELALFDASGREKGRWNEGNVILDSGKDRSIRLLLGDTGVCPTTVPTPCGVPGVCLSPAKYNWVCIGADTTAESSSQTTCINEGGLSANVRQQDTVPDFPSTGVGKIIVTFAAGVGTGTVTETALLACSSGVCTPTGLARKKLTSPGISKAAGDTLQITWTISQS